MATIKQRRALEKTLENKGNISKSMREVGYSPSVAKNPKALTESKGFKELAAEYGLTPELLTNALVDDIKAKPKNRKAELELGFKVLGISGDREDQTPEQPKTQNNFFINDSELNSQFAEMMKRKVLDANKSKSGRNATSGEVGTSQSASLDSSK